VNFFGSGHSDNFVHNNFFSHDVFNVAKTFELLHEASAFFLDGTEVLDFLSKLMDSLHGTGSDSDDLISEMADDLLETEAFQFDG